MPCLASLSGWAGPHLCQRHSFRVSKNLHAGFFHGICGTRNFPGASFQLVYFMVQGYGLFPDSFLSSSRAGTSTQRSLSSDGCWQPQQILWSYSLCPAASTWANILSYRYRQWSLPGSHQETHQKMDSHLTSTLPHKQRCPFLHPIFLLQQFPTL